MASLQVPVVSMSGDDVGQADVSYYAENQWSSMRSLVEAKVGAMKPGARARIGDEFAPGTSYTIVLELRGDGFDPSSIDPNLEGDAG
jgi:hypothetical protein